MNEITVLFQRLDHAQDTPEPCYATRLSAGMDLSAAIAAPLVLNPGQRELVPSGFAIAIPEGYEAQVRPRSGLALKHGITVLNAPGTIDADYRGEVKVILHNAGTEPFTLEPHMRFAQLVVAPVSRARISFVAELPESERDINGFGSTGLRALA